MSRSHRNRRCQTVISFWRQEFKHERQDVTWDGDAVEILLLCRDREVATPAL